MAVVDEKMTELHRKEMMECAQKGKGQRLVRNVFFDCKVALLS